MNDKEKRELAVSEIVLVVIGVIGLFAVVWLAWLRPSHRTPVNSYDSCVAAHNPVQTSYPSVCVTKDGKRFVNSKESVDPSVKAAETQQKYLSIPQWKVRIPLAPAFADLTYKYDKTDTYEGVFFAFTRLNNIGNCKAGIGVAVNRSTAQNQAPFTVDNPQAFKQVGSYYYYTTFSSSPCYDTDNPAQVSAVKAVNGGNLKDAVTSALQGLEAVPSN